MIKYKLFFNTSDIYFFLMYLWNFIFFDLCFRKKKKNRRYATGSFS